MSFYENRYVNGAIKRQTICKLPVSLPLRMTKLNFADIVFIITRRHTRLSVKSLVLQSRVVC